MHSKSWFPKFCFANAYLIKNHLVSAILFELCKDQEHVRQQNNNGLPK